MIDKHSTLTVYPQSSVRGEAKMLPASKSISNRVLILDALSGSKSTLYNLSDANDTRLMQKLIRSKSSEIDVEDAGTTMRFLTAYFAVTNQQKTMKGTARMNERPIGILVDALRTLGTQITYLGQEGFPPHRIEGFSGQKTNRIQVQGNVSSQYISALMMIGALLPTGLVLDLTGKIGSRPYIEMTLALMREFGVEAKFGENSIVIEAQTYKPVQSFTVESDWSAASYWFAIVALATEADISLPRLSDNSLQGDSEVRQLMEKLGVIATPTGNLLRLQKSAHINEIHIDFTPCPDLAQTIAVVCAAKGIQGRFTGLESLRIKETDRITALQNELSKIGAVLTETDGNWHLVPSSTLPRNIEVSTYHDHRMAMAFAPLATRLEVVIENPDVVRKSYPNFWNDLRTVGFRTS